MKGKFENFVKTFCIGTVLYIYFFILSDILRLNPNDDGDGAFIGMILGFFPSLAAILYLLLEGSKKKKVKTVAIWLPIILMLGLPLFVIFLNIGDGFSEVSMVLQIFFFFLIRASILVIPLAVYLIYIKTRDRTAFILLAGALIILGLSVYPAKDYIKATLSGDPCATKALIMKGAPIQQEIHGNVVCITVDRGYPSETYKWQVLKTTDAKTFEKLNDEYSKDKDTVFYEGVPVEGADAKTFTIYPKWKGAPDERTPYMRDSKNVYFRGERVPVQNITQFEIIELCNSDFCATDGTQIFKEGKVLSGIDIQSLRMFQSCEYSKDKNQVYHSGIPIESADVATFNIYGDAYYCYAFDEKLHLYYKGQLVSGANPVTFERVEPNDVFSSFTDGKNIYYDGKKLDLDMKSFQYLGKGTSKDATSVYYREEKIEGADAATFELVSISAPNVMNVCAKDKNHMYFDGEIGEHPVCKGEIF